MKFQDNRIDVRNFDCYFNYYIQITYLFAGLGGYLAFAEGTRDDILLNFNVTAGNANLSTAHSGLDQGCMAAGSMAYVMDFARVGFGIALIFS